MYPFDPATEAEKGTCKGIICTYVPTKDLLVCLGEYFTYVCTQVQVYPYDPATKAEKGAS